MDKLTWLKRVCKIINCRKHKNNITSNGYLPVSLFLVSGKFSNQKINTILCYGEKFIKELKY